MPTDTTGTTTMKAITYDRYGGPDVLRYSDIPRPDPGPEQVRIRVGQIKDRRGHLFGSHEIRIY